MSIIKINKNSIENYYNNLNSEKNYFKNTSYNSFKNSYIGNSGNSVVQSMYTNLNSLYSKIDTSYSNIGNYWSNFNSAFNSLENSLKSFSNQSTDSSVSGCLGNFVSNIPDNVKNATTLTDKGISADCYVAYFANMDKGRITKSSVEEASKNIKLYQQSLKEKGFPDSYLDDLTKLHYEYPNWEFKATKVGSSLDICVDIQYKNNNDMNLTYDITRSNLDGNEVEPGWYTANRDSIKKSMDPKNYLNSKSIFMFEDLKYNKDSDVDLKNTLKNTFLDDKFKYNGKEYNYSDCISESGKKSNVSPLFIKTRILQESGNDGSITTNMEDDDGKVYHNYFNYNAYGSSASEIKDNALKYSKEKGWDNPYTTISDGSSKLYEDYIGNGQNTMYYQKYNVNSEDKSSHQYMANIDAPKQEGDQLYESYNDLGVLDKKHTFDIPVYSD